MSFKCNIGLHVWDGCTCTECGKVRSDHHDLKDNCEKCAKCGTVIPDQHNWSHDCEKCSKCGATRENIHDWRMDCETCTVCGTNRKGHHELVDGICVKCGHGTFTDKRDDLAYRVVKIGDQILMAENFKRIPNDGNSWSYEGEEKNVGIYGYLYDFETAQKMTPAGWHLPSKEEWETLIQDLGGNDKHLVDKLKKGGESGFDGLNGGLRNARGAFNSLGASGHFCCSTQESDDNVCHFKISTLKGAAEFEKGEKSIGLSVRYFRDK